MDVGAAELKWGIQQVPKGSATQRSATPAANPFVSLLPNPAQVDMFTWRATMSAGAERREHERRKPVHPLTVRETERANTHANDSTRTAQRIRQFGTGRREHFAAAISGVLAPNNATVVIPPAPEDNGSIPLAGDLGLSRSLITQIRGRIGDGPHGSGGDGTGDFDFFKIDAKAGQILNLDVDTPINTLDTIMVLWSKAGEIIAVNDDSGGLDSLLTVRLTTAGPFYVSIAGFPQSFPGDPFESGSGDGAGSEGDYALTASIDDDIDGYAIDLKPGDVIGGSVEGAARQLELVDPRGRLVVSSTQDASSSYPANSPLPGGGNAVLAHVADTAGRYTLRVLGGIGSYAITLEAYRAGGETTRKTQTVFLDFDGAILNPGLLGCPGVCTLSPLKAFLPGWGLHPRDENALISAIVAVVKENVAADPRRANSGMRVQILNSRDDRDPTGRPDVSRVIVGGTIEESGIFTIGISQSIDPGNFQPAETALVQLDLMSAPAADQPDISLNSYLTPASNRITFVGQAVGNVVSHEIGHYLGSFHVDASNSQANLMDQGGNFPLLYGVGPDGIGGTRDDRDVDYGKDAFSPQEGFVGIENTLATTAFGLTRRR